MPHYPSSGLQYRIHRAKYLSGRLGGRFVLPPSPHYHGLPQMVEDIPESGDAPHGATSLHFSTNAEERALSLVGHYFFTCFRLCKNWGGYYLAARAGFKVSGAPTNNKGWKARYMFVSNLNWGFMVDWSIHQINNIPPFLSEESIMVNRLKGILSLYRAIRDRTELWLVEAGLSPASRGGALTVLPIAD
ncbi:hypothetical protein BHM03_00031099 [Ensete ventricosum]|uniref:Uncharacterized protein n=1 Tax=Ensete ventricosum TaxID=4639 RepID=A0A445MI93_ENSVE|nr:hypothetical protein BHM03_00031099 [Ensete ventricosum]